MADISYGAKATVRRSPASEIPGKGEAGNLKVLTSTIEVSATTSGTTIKLARLPSNARLAINSVIYWDDLTSSGSPTLDVGVGSVDANVTSDPDGINDGLDITSAGTNRLVKDFANAGKELWQFVNGQSSDPGGFLDIYASIKDDAIAGETGTVTLEALYSLD
jgi:hypothetical protein